MKPDHSATADKAKHEDHDRRGRAIRSIAPAALLSLNIFVFGVVVIYSGNPGEFLVPLEDVMALIAVPGSILFLALVLIALVLSKNGWVIFNAVITVLSVATYLHGNLLYWETGVLDGSALDLSRHWRSLADAALWLALAWLAWKYRKWLALHAWQICLALILIQAISAAIQVRDLGGNLPQFEEYPDQLSWLSPDENVIHIILDAFQASIFEYLVTEDDGLKNEFDGFTFFRDALTASDVTYLSLPATLTGKAFTNKTKISEYHDQTLGGRNLLTVMAEQGYSVDVATPVWWNEKRDEFAAYYRMPTPFVGRDETEKASASLLLDISIFRHLPHFLKSTWYRDGTWVFSSMLADHPGQQFSHFAHNAFFSDLTQHTAVRSPKPAYKFIHLVTPHAPLVTDPDCNFTGKELSYALQSFASQSRCTLDNVVRYLHRLKELGVYDNSLIIIHGDHGGGVPFDMLDTDGQAGDSATLLHNMWGNPLPMVLIKPRNARGPLQISGRQVSLLDIPATVMDLVHGDPEFPGTSMFSPTPAEPPVRHYFRSSMHRNNAAARDHFDDFSSFRVQGSVYEKASWSEENFYQVSGTTPRGEYAWGTSLTFGKRGNFKPFQAGGWTATRSQDISWTDGKSMSLSIPFPNVSGDVQAVMSVKPLLAPGKLDKQRVTVSVGGTQIAQWALTHSRFQQLEFTIPGSLLNTDGPTEIHFALPDAQSPESLEIGDDKRALGLAFLKLRFDLVEPD